MKKFLTVLLAVMLVLSACALTGCKKETAAQAPESDWAYVSEKGTLIVGMTLFAPMDYYEEGSDVLIGFDADLARAVGEKLGIEVVFQEINWDAKETELSSKTIDVIWNGMTLSPDRIENMSCSKPYMNNRQSIVVRASESETILAAMEGLIVVAEQGSAAESQITGDAAEFFTGTTYVPVDSMAKALMEVKSLTADIAVVDSVCALGMVGEGTDFEDLVMILDYEFGPEQYGFACRKGSDLTAMIDQAIDELAADGTLAEIAARYGLADILTER